MEFARNLILGLDVGNLADWLAGDFNGSGFTTSYDIHFMTKCNVFMDPVFPPTWSPWRFVPESAWAANNPPNGDMN